MHYEKSCTQAIIQPASYTGTKRLAHKYPFVTQCVFLATRLRFVEYDTSRTNADPCIVTVLDAGGNYLLHCFLVSCWSSKALLIFFIRSQYAQEFHRAFYNKIPIEMEFEETITQRAQPKVFFKFNRATTQPTFADNQRFIENSWHVITIQRRVFGHPRFRLPPAKYSDLSTHFEDKKNLVLIVKAKEVK